MIDLQQAIQIAKEYAMRVLEVNPNEILLEEIVPSKEHLKITLSFHARRKLPSPNIAEIMRATPSIYDDREFKSFKLNKDTGDVEGMFNVQPA